MNITEGSTMTAKIKTICSLPIKGTKARLLNKDGKEIVRLGNVELVNCEKSALSPDGKKYEPFESWVDITFNSTNFPHLTNDYRDSSDVIQYTLLADCVIDSKPMLAKITGVYPESPSHLNGKEIVISQL